VSDPQPIPEFSDRQPIRLWRHQDIDCAIYMGTRAPCGYVRLPESSPLRPIAEAADVVHRTEQHDEAFQDWIDAHPPGAFGYQGLDEVLDVHGGLTFGPTESGWIGFDTGHGFDLWQLDELRQWIPEGSVERQHFEEIVKLGAHISQIIGQHRDGFVIDWTLEKLVHAVEHLAEQVLAVKVES
jgi:hypothetical protein